MSWQQVIGQKRVKELLKRAITNGQIAHAYLFYGNEGVGQDAMAIEFARVLNCLEQRSEACDVCQSCKKGEALRHPNIHLIFELPVGKGEAKDDGPLEKLSEEQINEVRGQISRKTQNAYHRIEIQKANFIKINSIREIRRAAAMSSFERGKKIFVIVNAENMNAEASNSLLKTLEEPPGNTILILTTSQKNKLLPTIISRCQFVQFDLLEESEICEALMKNEGIEPEQASIVARLSAGSYASAQELLSRDLVKERQEVVDFLRIILGAQKVSLSNAIDRLASSHDRTSLERWLKMLQSWMRDALILQESGSATLIRIDSNKDVESFVNRFPRANLFSALEAVDRQIALINKNVYLPLVLTNLAIDLKNYLSQRSS